MVDAIEQCDDGNTLHGDDCSAACQIEDADGDGIRNNVDNCPTVANSNGAGKDFITIGANAVVGDGENVKMNVADGTTYPPGATVTCP